MYGYDNITRNGSQNISKKERLTFVALLTFSALLTLIGNVFFILTVVSTKKLQKTVNVLLANLALANILQAALISPLHVEAMYKGKWLAGLTFCKCLPAIHVALFCIGLTTHTFIAINRRLFVAQKYTLYRKIFSRMFITIIFLTLWIIFIATILVKNRLLKDNLYVYNNVYAACVYKTQKSDVIISVVLAIVNYSIIIYCYCKIYFSSDCKINPDIQKSMQPVLKNIKIITIAFIIFSCSWIPYPFFYAIDRSWKKFPHTLHRVSYCLTEIQSALMPILFYLASSEYRKAFHNVILCRCASVCAVDLHLTDESMEFESNQARYVVKETKHSSLKIEMGDKNV